MEDLPVRRGLVIPASELSESVSRSSGPGGQHVNKTSTRITLRWNVQHSEALSDSQRKRLLRRLQSRLTSQGELILHARSRSQARNRESVRERLASVVREGLARQRPRLASKPSKRSVSRAVAAGKRRSELKRGRRRPLDDD
ncbi:MAG: alternative ribosome rescue aminoacyl-tRNA hydrolase ArfB [Myxococcota bacterium]